MGNDGGSIPTRRELVKNAARAPNASELKATEIEAFTHAWTFCPLSQRLLSTPIVSDCAGTLYNKDAILEFLLPQDDAEGGEKGKEEKEAVLQSRVKGLKDVVEVKFTEEKTERGESRQICPITSKELGANTKAVYLVPCGHAFSEVAVKELGESVCGVCSEVYGEEGVVNILPMGKDDLERMEERIRRLKEKGLTHSLKKASGAKKRKKDVEEKREKDTESKTGTNGESQANGAVDKAKARIAETGVPTPQSRSGTSTPASGIKNAATASLTARVLDEQEERSKRRKLGLNDNLKSLFSNKDAGREGAIGGADFMTRGYSIPRKA